MDAAFQAAETHGIRAILGKVMMDRITYDPTIEPTTILERSLARAEAHRALARGYDGRLGYAVTPRFAISCTADMLREIAVAGPRAGPGGRPIWRRIRSNRRGRPALPRRPRLRRRLRPRRRLGRRSVMAHAVHLRRANRTDSRDRDADRALRGLEPVHRGRLMPLGRYRRAGCRWGSARTCPAAPRPRSSRHAGRRLFPDGAPIARRRPSRPCSPRSTGCAWGRSTGHGRSGSTTIGSLETGKEADLIAVDPVGWRPCPRGRRDLPGGPRTARGPADLPSRRLDGPCGLGPRPPIG